MRDYYELLYTNKMNNQEEMAKLLEMHNVRRLNHKEIQNIKKPSNGKKIKSVIKKKKTSK